MGCGHGAKAKDLFDAGMRVLGIDFSTEMIKIARKIAPDCKFKILDIKNIDQLQGEFDGIFAQAVLFHFSKIELPKILKKIYFKLKKGGYFYIAVKQIGLDKIEEKIKIENDYGYNYARFFAYYTYKEIKECLYELKFKIIKDNSRVMKNKIGDKNWIVFIAQK